MDISFLEEARNTLSYWHFGFHVINRPQSGPGLKYFMRLGGIGFSYDGKLAAGTPLRLLQRKHRAAAI